MTRVGLVGCGRWGRNILRDLLELGAEVHVAAPSADNRDKALQLGAASAHGSASDLPAVDGYVVATPTVSHAEVVEPLLASGRPIFVEKPMTCDVASARRLAEAGAGRLFVMEKWRYHPGVQALAEIVRSGELGEILSVRCYRLGWGNPHDDVDAWWILMPHDLAIADHVLGRLPAAASVLLPSPTRPQLAVIATLSDGPGPSVTLELAATHPASRRATVVEGTLGSAQLADSYDDHVLVGRWNGGEASPPERRPIGQEMPLKAELQAFLGHLAGGPPPMVSAQVGLQAVETIAALRRMAGLD